MTPEIELQYKNYIEELNEENLDNFKKQIIDTLSEQLGISGSFSELIEEVGFNLSDIEKDENNNIVLSESGIEKIRLISRFIKFTKLLQSASEEKEIRNKIDTSVVAFNNYCEKQSIDYKISYEDITSKSKEEIKEDIKKTNISEEGKHYLIEQFNKIYNNKVRKQIKLIKEYRENKIRIDKLLNILDLDLFSKLLDKLDQDLYFNTTSEFKSSPIINQLLKQVEEELDLSFISEMKYNLDEVKKEVEEKTKPENIKKTEQVTDTIKKQADNILVQIAKKPYTLPLLLLSALTVFPGNNMDSDIGMQEKINGENSLFQVTINYEEPVNEEVKAGLDSLIDIFIDEVATKHLGREDLILSLWEFMLQSGYESEKFTLSTRLEKGIFTVGIINKDGKQIYEQNIKAEEHIAFILGFSTLEVNVESLIKEINGDSKLNFQERFSKAIAIIVSNIESSLTSTTIDFKNVNILVNKDRDKCHFKFTSDNYEGEFTIILDGHIWIDEVLDNTSLNISNFDNIENLYKYLKSEIKKEIGDDTNIKFNFITDGVGINIQGQNHIRRSLFFSDEEKLRLIKNELSEQLNNNKHKFKVPFDIGQLLNQNNNHISYNQSQNEYDKNKISNFINNYLKNEYLINIYPMETGYQYLGNTLQVTLKIGYYSVSISIY